VFYAPETDKVLFETIKNKTKSSIDVIEVSANINDPLFAEQAVNHLLMML